jgi:hypothetical protein
MADNTDFATARMTLLTELYNTFLTRWGTAVTSAASLEKVSRQPDGTIVESVDDGKFPCCSQSTFSNLLGYSSFEKKFWRNYQNLRK